MLMIAVGKEQHEDQPPSNAFSIFFAEEREVCHFSTWQQTGIHYL